MLDVKAQLNPAKGDHGQITIIANIEINSWKDRTWSAVQSGVSICNNIFDQIIDIRECKQKNFKIFSVFVFSNFIHLPFF